MLTYILKRIALALPTLLVVSFLVFLTARLAPSGPVEILAGEKATPQEIAEIKKRYGLDRPYLVQYADYVWGIVSRGDFGTSFSRGGQPVTDMIKKDFPVTATLATLALLFALLVGLPIGILAALKHNSVFDRAVMSVVVAMISVPSIVLGPLLVLFLAVQLRVLPTDGWETALHVYILGRIDIPIPQLQYTILPMIALGSRSAALMARFMRASLLETLRQDYMRTAVAKGLSRRQAIWKHGLKNAFLPILTVIGTNFGVLLSGSFVVETIFRVPGIGYESVQSITKRDYPVIQGIALLVAVCFILVNLAVDVLYGVIDPRVRSQEAKV
jgi:peptide/nickel transport system permease protein